MKVHTCAVVAGSDDCWPIARRSAEGSKKNDCASFLAERTPTLWALWVATVLTTIAFPALPCSRGLWRAKALAAESAERAVTVTVAPITVREAQRTVGAVGSFFGFDEVTVSAEVTGHVARILHDVGDIVQPGDVLLEIDPVDYELALEETLRSLQLDVARIVMPVPPDEAFEPAPAQAILRHRSGAAAAGRPCPQDGR